MSASTSTMWSSPSPCPSSRKSQCSGAGLNSELGSSSEAGSIPSCGAAAPAPSSLASTSSLGSSNSGSGAEPASRKRVSFPLPRRKRRRFIGSSHLAHSCTGRLRNGCKRGEAVTGSKTDKVRKQWRPSHVRCIRGLDK
ncbi:unnamed protein product [Chrysoparadoxa australica]